MENLKKKKISAMFTAVIIFVSVLLIGIVYTPRILGYKPYTIETGSMSPTIPQGSMVYVKSVKDFEEYQVNDVVTFSANDGQGSFTHRIVEINEAERSFVTKGDANSDVDLTPTDCEFAVGKVQLAIPYLGFAASFLKNKVVKIAVAVIYIAWAAIEIEVFSAGRKKRDE